VFFGRWLPGLRVVVAWLAGAERLSWRRFLLWNSLGGVAWAASIASVAYALGRSASGYVGLIGLIGIAAAGLIFAARRLRRASSLARTALRELGHGLIDLVAFALVALVVTVLELNELRHEAANALATPKGHG
jgi:hypothetical protein